MEFKTTPRKWAFIIATIIAGIIVFVCLSDGGFVLYSVGANGKDDLQTYSSPQDLQRMIFSAPHRPYDDVAWLEPPPH